MDLVLYSLARQKRKKKAPQEGFELGTLRFTELRATTRPQWVITPHGRVVYSMELEKFSGEKMFLLAPKGMSPVRKRKFFFSVQKLTGGG